MLVKLVPSVTDQYVYKMQTDKGKAEIFTENEPD